MEVIHPDTQIFDGQVAGHGNILQLPNDTLVKVSSQTEIDFYKIVEEKNIPIKKFMPKCYNFDPYFEEVKEKYLPKEDNKIYINMENLLSSFKNPTVMDLKLGTRLYDDNASEEKKQRMILNAASTTSLKTGLKICGLRITDKSDKTVMKFDKKYGRALNENNLANGVLRFLLNFSEEGYKNVTVNNLEEEMDQEIFNIKPSKYTLGFLQEILNKTYQLKETIMESPVRIYGCSLCIIYETINVEEEIKKFEKSQSLKNKIINSNESINTNDIDSDNHDDYNSSKNDQYHYQYPYSYYLIDFAHANLVDPELGEDPSMMKGIDRLISILEKYIYEKGY
ncbi:SAICAR synthase-like protein [Anaeromyces robustus]|uniref:Kinase n=1 Tax=Anaeromyces robustus TaxID=1754192 RepID=A0A1Y1XD84_9FUNG|nr:SAICAR synthase-like protein [Anaeromyces robustus]|eukprot:ORX83677.1 SAICAR synthase-like protein [Anaeromyces robustus]